MIIHDDPRRWVTSLSSFTDENLRLEKMTVPLMATQLVSRGARTEAQSHWLHPRVTPGSPGLPAWGGTPDLAGEGYQLYRVNLLFKNEGGRKWVLVTETRPTLCDPMDYHPPGSTVHGIFQARILEWVVIPSSRGSSPPRDQAWVSCIAGRFFFFFFLTIWATREAIPPPPAKWSYC